VTTFPVAAARTVALSAIYGLAKQTVLLTVTPPPAATISSLTISPDQVPGGSNTQGTVTLTAPAGSGGLRVDLRSSSIITATVTPNFLIIPQGQISATFVISTSRFTGVVTITATAGAVSKTATLTVQ
jgi:hypothetical protein